MAAHDKALIIDSLCNTWSASSGTVASGASCQAVVTAAGAKSYSHMTSLGWSMRNPSAVTVACTLVIAHVSVQGTVVASWDIQLAPGPTASFDNWAVNIKGKKGASLAAGFQSSATSVFQKVSIAGWYDSLSDG